MFKKKRKITHMKYILKKMTVLMVLVGFISFMTAVSFNGVEAKSEKTYDSR